MTQASSQSDRTGTNRVNAAQADRGPVPRGRANGRLPEPPPGSCSVLARLRGDPLLATAAPASRWLLLEVAAAWPMQIISSPVVAGAAAVLNQVVQRRGGRVLFVRRPQATRQPGGDLPSYVVVDAHTRTQTHGVWRPGTAEQAPDLTAALADFDGETPYGQAAQPRLLVCTHAKRDQCCAVRGRPLAATLAGTWPEAVWECSHLGGDRFAPNVLSLPDGVYLGQVDAADAVAVIGAHLDGRTQAAYFRGVTMLDHWRQAALAGALRELGPADPRALTAYPVTRSATEALLKVTGHPVADRITIRVRQVVLPAARRACGDLGDKVAVTYTADLVP